MSTLKLVPIPSERDRAMAAHLAGCRIEDREDPRYAATYLLQHGYSARAIAEGLEAALALAGEGIRAAASDHPVALWISRARDLAAGLVLLIAAGHGTGWLA